MDNASTSPVTPALLFIPDISGFTQFVSETAAVHSSHIIGELLEILIDANEIDLVVSEIEGDAVLYYRRGPAPTAAELLGQVQRMYVRFHAHLRKYETLRICQCGACRSAINLKLKFVGHYGEVGLNDVKGHSKLFGRDVIVAHRLLKNEVAHPEYVLLTDPLVEACGALRSVEGAAWASVERGSGIYDSGPAEFAVVPLDHLKRHIPEPKVQDYSFKGPVTNVLHFDTVIEAPLDLVFDVVSDLSRRHLWMEGLKGSDRLNSRITQVGSTHRCIMKGTESDPFFVTHDFGVEEDYVTFADTDHKLGFCTVFELRRLGERNTRLELHCFMKANFLKVAIFNLLMKKKHLETLAASASNLNAYCKELLSGNEAHPAQIVLWA